MEADELRRHVIRSIILSLMCFGVPFLSWLLGVFIPSMVAVALTVFWLMILGIGVHRFGRRGLWALVGAPVVLAWPCFLSWFMFLCLHGGDGS